jgi:hypothetical protein
MNGKLTGRVLVGDAGTMKSGCACPEMLSRRNSYSRLNICGIVHSQLNVNLYELFLRNSEIVLPALPRAASSAPYCMTPPATRHARTRRCVLYCVLGTLRASDHAVSFGGRERPRGLGSVLQRRAAMLRPLAVLALHLLTTGTVASASGKNSAT